MKSWVFCPRVAVTDTGGEVHIYLIGSGGQGD